MNVNAVIDQLLNGHNVHKRSGSRVFRVHGGGTTVAEVVVGDATVRLNMRELSEDIELIAESEGISPKGRSKTWKGGGVKVTPENVSSVREVLDALVREARIRATRTVTVRESLAILERARKDGLLDEKFERDIAQLLQQDEQVTV